jgi:hypothetical protein
VTSPLPAALAAADELARTLSEPRTAWRGEPPPGGRSWPQSLAGGAGGIALLHVERARTGRGDWQVAHTWLSIAVSGEVSAAANANLFFGAPALAYVLHIAADASRRYRRVQARLNEATLALTRSRLDEAHRRIDRAERAEMREFDLIRGLTGLGSYHLARHPEHQITRDVLSYLVRLTEPLPHLGALPPWWTSVAPNGEPSSQYPHGHGNLGLSHGIGSAMAMMSLALLRGVEVPGLAEAVDRICTWTDQWRQDGDGGSWWPGLITIEQVREKRIARQQRPRPSWCYGVAGSARAQQLAGVALRDTARKQTAENAMLAALRDPDQLDLLPETGLCHGTAGLLLAAWRMATDAGSPEIAAHLPHLTTRLIAALDRAEHNPELLDGTAGAALALHTVGTSAAPAPHWDAFLALA